MMEGHDDEWLDRCVEKERKRVLEEARKFMIRWKGYTIDENVIEAFEKDVK